MSTPSAVLPKPRKPRAASQPLPDLKASDQAIKGLTGIFDLLADENRLRILVALAQHGEMHVSALCAALRHTSQPAVSHHLKLLRLSSLIGCRRDGRHNYYYIHSTLVQELLEQFFSANGNGHKRI